MRDAITAAVRQLAATFRQDAAQRRRFTPNDQAADAIDACASELLAELARVEEATRTLSPDEYAAAHQTTASSVRRWCARGELAAIRNAAGDWAIPRDARREKKAG